MAWSRSPPRARWPSGCSELFDGVAAIVEAQRPVEAAVEETFVNVNPGSTLKLGQARGVVLLAPARAGLPVFEYAANLVKKSVTGAGHADKRQIAMMVGRLLPGVEATRRRRRCAGGRDLPRPSSRHRQAGGGGALIAKLKGVVDPSTPTARSSTSAASATSSRPRRAPCAISWSAATVTVLVETIVREDAIALYGFLETAERDWFRILTTVQGVGARVALSILSTLSPDEIARAIAAQDRAHAQPAGGRRAQARGAARHRAQGQGRRLRRRARWRKGADAPAMPAGSINEDAVSALVNLGYKRGSRRSARWRA